MTTPADIYNAEHEAHEHDRPWLIISPCYVRVSDLTVFYNVLTPGLMSKTLWTIDQLRRQGVRLEIVE